MGEIIAFLIVCGPMLLMMWYNHAKKKVEQENQKKLEAFDKEIDDLIRKSVGGTLRDRFFIECVLSECDDFTKERNIRKAQMFADKYGVSYSGSGGIEAAFNNAMQEHLRITGKALRSSWPKNAKQRKRNLKYRAAILSTMEKKKRLLC